MLIAEEREPCLEVPVEVVPMEELESVLENSSNGTVVTSRYFLQPVEELAKKHSVRAVAVDLNDFRQELAMLKELRPGSCVGLVSISPGILRAAEVILHSMRGNELLLMTATPDVGSRLLALLPRDEVAHELAKVVEVERALLLRAVPRHDVLVRRLVDVDPQ